MIKYSSFAFVFFFFLSFNAQERILVDGNFSDWEDKPINYSDVVGDGGNSEIDFGIFKVSHDDRFFFFYIELNAEINLQSDEDVTLYIDTDDNINSGLSIHGIGAELSYNFGARSGWYYGPDGSSLPVFQNNIGLASAPTVTSEFFEICIKREIELFGNELFTSNILNFALENGNSGDVIPSSEGSISYDVVDFTLGALPSYSIAKPENSDIRILSYNVLFNGLFDSENYDQHSRILNAIRPDIIGYQEIYNYDSQEVQTIVESMLTDGTGITWYNSQAGDTDNHLISKHPILETYVIQGVGSGASSGNGAFLVDVPSLNEHMLIIVGHTPCCDNNEGRQYEIDAIMAFIRNAKAGIGPLSLEENSPIVIIGDMNLVGFNQQLTTFLTGDIVNETQFGPDFNPDWDQGDFKDSRPYTTNLPGNFSWYDEESSFSPGRLDFNIYSSSVLNLENSFALFTPALHLDTLDANGLLQNDVTSVSDHLPIICDFSYQEPNSVLEFEESLDLQIYPNPAADQLFIKLTSENLHKANVKIFDMLGKDLGIEVSQLLHPGQNTILVNLKDIEAGDYLLEISIGIERIHNLITKF